MYEKKREKLQIKSNEKITDIKERLSAIELNVLVENKVFQKFGTTEKGTYYTLHPALKAQKTQKSRTKGVKEVRMPEILPQKVQPIYSYLPIDSSNIFAG